MFIFGYKRIAKELFVIGCALALGSAATASTFEAICAGESKVDADGSVWSAGYAEKQAFSIDVATTGILVLDVSVDSMVDKPRLAFLGRGCMELGSAEDFVTVEQGAAYQVIAIRVPGTYSLRVMSAGIGRLLGEYELHSSFTPAEIVEEETVVELDQSRRVISLRSHFVTHHTGLKSDVLIVDPDPGLASDTWGEKSDVLIVDPDPGLASDTWNEKSDVLIVDPDPSHERSGASSRPLLSLVTLYAVESSASEVEVSDMENVSKSHGRGAIIATSVVFPGEIETDLHRLVASRQILGLK